ncbi:MAG: 30S ribosomal protein S17 [Candidatus Brocadia carolinensis]|uniref:Small ribosomal subunit protein uS17 n=1 Tax=Candidatus Brocadia carolinensis TaxID=1004156 RepID=A0A1V4AQK5_9BACT|nr:MAG: 30S ribosomal protein S17 [Candidatus Brocadia caroliniensis]
MKEESVRGRRRKVVGMVIGDKMQKTIVVEVMRLVKHAKYGKYIKRSTVYKTHDEKKEARVGDKVEIIETRPLSKTKATKLVRVIEKANR